MPRFSPDQFRVEHRASSSQTHKYYSASEMSFFRQIEEEKLVDAISKRQVIYDLTCTGYKNQEIRFSAWREISQIVGRSVNLVTNKDVIVSTEMIKEVRTMQRWYSILTNYVPKHKPPCQKDAELLQEFVEASRQIVILTGAGISTESGIPDYRSEEVGLYARSNHKPVQYQEFVRSADVRKRYWARNFVGWPRFSSCQPNETHAAIQRLELLHKKASCIITQNVDGLHYKAGSENVIELHGSAFRVHCMTCERLYDRSYVQKTLNESNPNMRETGTMIRPDGDVEISQDKIISFKPPYCEDCGGVLKPDIVFFGDNVPRSRVDAVRTAVLESDSLLVLGSSLTTYSSYRIILQAIEEQKPVCIVNIGATRADNLVPLKISAKCGDLLPKYF